MNSATRSAWGTKQRRSMCPQGLRMKGWPHLGCRLDGQYLIGSRDLNGRHLLSGFRLADVVGVPVPHPHARGIHTSAAASGYHLARCAFPGPLQVNRVPCSRWKSTDLPNSHFPFCACILRSGLLCKGTSVLQSSRDTPPCSPQRKWF